MKKLFILLILFCNSFFSYSQPFRNWKDVDSAYLSDSGYILQSKEHIFIDEQKTWGYKVPYVITNDSLLKIFTRGCEDYVKDINFNTHIILQGRFWGDCHAEFKSFIYMDTTAKKLIWRVYNIYGGCRAAGSESFIYKIPKPPIGYTIKVEEILIDEIHNRYEMR